MTRTALVALLLLATVACGDEGLGGRWHLEIARDTVVLHGDAPTLVPARVIDRRGRDVERVRLRPAAVDPGIVTARLGWLQCRRDGATLVRYEAGRARDSVVVACRRARAVTGPDWLDLRVGDTPVPLRFTAVLPDGRREPIDPLALESRDSIVARVVDGALLPVGPGRTRLHVSLGGLRSNVTVTVTEAIADDTLRLAPGEFRSWRLPRGRYTLTVRGVGRPLRHEEFEVTAEGARCQTNSRYEDSVFCMVYDSAAVAVRDLRAGGDGPRQVAAVTILRTP